MEEPLPRFALDEARPESGLVLGRVSTTTHGRQVWVKDGVFGFLVEGDELHPGRWHRRDERWAFAPERPESLERLRSRAEWSVLEGYLGTLHEVVLDRSRTWRRVCFEPTDAVRRGSILSPADQLRGEGGERVPGGWDHEHCELCWSTIGPGGHASGWCADAHTWVCEECHRRFVGPRRTAGLEEYSASPEEAGGAGPEPA